MIGNNFKNIVYSKNNKIINYLLVFVLKPCGVGGVVKLHNLSINDEEACGESSRH